MQNAGWLQQVVTQYTLLDACPLPKVDQMVEKTAKYSFTTADLKSVYHRIPIRDENKTSTALEACEDLFPFRWIPFGVTNDGSGFQMVIDRINAGESLSYIRLLGQYHHLRRRNTRNLSWVYSAAEKYKLTLNDSENKTGLLGYEICRIDQTWPWQTGTLIRPTHSKRLEISTEHHRAFCVLSTVDTALFR